CSVHEITGHLFLPFPGPWTGAAGLNLFQSPSASIEFLGDGFDGCGPHERLGILVPGPQERFDSGLQILHAMEDPAPDGLIIQHAEPAFYQVQPTGTGGYKVKHKARVTFQPSPHIGMFVSPVVIDDQMERDLTRKLLIESAQEPKELLMPMPLIALADNLPLQHLQGGEQSRSAVPLVIVGHRSTTALLN